MVSCQMVDDCDSEVVLEWYAQQTGLAVPPAMSTPPENTRPSIAAGIFPPLRAEHVAA